MIQFARAPFTNLSRVVLFLVIAISSMIQACATLYYVDSTAGLDTNNGTSTATPWKTLSKANAAALNPGDQLLFIYGGTWTGTLSIKRAGTSASPIVYGAYGMASLGNPTINAAGGNNSAAIIIQPPAAYITVQNFTVTNFYGASFNADVTSVVTGDSEVNRSGILVQDNWISYPTTVQASTAGIRILNNTITQIEGSSNNPNASTYPRGQTTYSGNQYTCAAIFVPVTQVSGLTIENNTITNCTGTGIYLAPSLLPNGMTPTQNASNVLVQGNSINNIGSDGIELLASTSPVVQYNSCIGAGNNSYGGTWPTGTLGFHGFACCGMWAGTSSNVLFQYNYCQGTHNIYYDGEAWDFDIGLSGTCVYQYNYSRDNEGGFMLSQSGTISGSRIVRDNISVNDGSRQGINNTGGNNGEGFFNQVVEYTYNNIFYRTDGKGFLMPSSAKGTFENNIFYTTATTNITYQTANALFNNNCFYGHTPVNPGTSPLLANPDFADETAAAAGTALTAETGFQLLRGSPCIDAGAAVSSNGGLDFWGYPLSTSSTNIGASAFTNQALAGGQNNSLAIRGDGSIWIWGGSGKTAPAQVTSLSHGLAISLGSGNEFVVKTDGTLWAWGANSFGQLGDGTTTNPSAPEQITSLSGMTEVSGGGYFTIALKSDGTVWAAGNNGDGQLGNGNTSSSTSYVEVQASSGVNFTGVVAIAAGGYTGYALKGDGTLWAWGRNSGGEIGDNTYTQRPYPVQVLTGVNGITAGMFHAVAVKSDGTVWAWGINTDGQVGNGTTSYNVRAPYQIGGLTNIVRAASQSSAYHSVALKSDGTVWAWGLNANGQLGDGTTTLRTTPVLVQASSGVNYTGAVLVASGATYSFAPQSGGTIWGWGNNANGQLGTGNTTSSSYPVQTTGTFVLSMLRSWSHVIGLDRIFFAELPGPARGSSS